jgi:predicted transcriptional regulator
VDFQDYDNIRKIIDDIIGIDTMQGHNLKKAVKNYFETKPRTVKLASTQETLNVPNTVKGHTLEAEAAMRRYTKRLQEDNKKLKENGEYCGISG